MRTFIRHQLWPAVILLLALTVITGVIYPAAITAVGQVAFRDQANGSFITTTDGRLIGSSLIGQAFSDPKYLWGRLSAAGADGYDANASAGSNLGPTNATLIQRLQDSVASFKAQNGDRPIPVDLITTSASGLDPDISPAAATYQVARIAQARGISSADVQAVVERHTEGALLGFLGQPRVHVLLVNLDLDGLLAK